MKKIFLSIALVSISLLSFAQNSYDSESAKNSTEPEIVTIKQPLIEPRIEIFGMQFGFPVSNFYVNLQADINLSEKLSLTAKFDPSDWDMKKAVFSSTSDNLIALKSAKEYAAGFELTLFTKYKLAEKRLILNSETISHGLDYDVVRKTYRPVTYNVPTQVRLRAGLQGYSSNVRPKKYNSTERITLTGTEYPAIKAADGTVLDEWNPSAVNAVMVYGGLSFKKINYFEAVFKSTHQYGVWRHTSNVFFDVFYAPLISVGNVKHTSVEYDVNDSYSKQPFGFRFGRQMTAYARAKTKFGLSVSWEAGMLPGIGKFPLYGKTSIGLTFNYVKIPPVVFDK